ncbi:Thiol-disulfide oxidoreductase ResA [Lentibacillus sp. JNUCC-1]|uniref:thiol-disulfide oxidoreductase ResA n=1 Tax=Lentibacillus sp. JNUCC-1 TaxID=2654513 RepID=UPI0012E70111|nr:thiol-disulfide oxidoreductase ResA [Lentibacillus sp. JNUCC-1]MUV39744.1 Thiol-disulfide oxidoreductase ResA [Lentibacillus sp. JNUCC-1]
MSLEERKKAKQKKKRKRLIIRSVILAVLLAAVVYALIDNLQKDKSIYKAGDQAPDFELMQVNEHNEMEKVRLSDLQGKGVMLNFWATFCDPCKAEMPYMQNLYPEYKDKGIEIVAVSLDNTELRIDQFIEQYGLTFPIPQDKKDTVREKYKIGPIPTTFFIDPDGVIVEKVEGALTLDRLEGHLKDIMPE